mgnify:CR=1 FL=1
MRAMTLVLLLAFASVPLAAGQTEAEIEYLLQYVSDSGCAFNRNGSEHDSADAADHLRLKYSRGRRYVDSAEQFIDRLATESSWTGRTYTVNCEGRTQPSGPWLHQALTEYRNTGL